MTRDRPTPKLVCEETKMLTPLRTNTTTQHDDDSLGQAVTTPIPDENESTLRLNFDQHVSSNSGIVVD